MRRDLYALVDCNNFYVSCERVFNPELRGKPVIVLSNNDGCAIARSEEAKALGFRMGQPFFECGDLTEKHHGYALSSNYVLYGDISQRVMHVLASFTPRMEVYSIDEAFLLLRGFSRFDLEEYAYDIKRAVYQKTGIPVSVGIGKTKTLAKIANYIAKRVVQTGVFCLLEDMDAYLRKIPVEKVWGVGRKRSCWLNTQGVYTAADLKDMSDALVKQKMTVTGLRTVWELRGVSCLKIEEMAPDKKSVSHSRMFGRDVENLPDMEEAVASYIARAAGHLRRHNLLAGYIHLYIETSRFRGAFYNDSLGMYVNPPSADTPLLASYGKLLLRKVFKEGRKYKKAGVCLANISSERQRQKYFSGPVDADTKQERLMRVIDKYNQAVNRGKIQFASEGLNKSWRMRQLRKSQRFTTNWNELLEIRI